MSKQIVLDANILIRGILGSQVPQLLKKYRNQIQFFTTGACYQEIRQHLPNILEKRKMVPEPFLEGIELLEAVVVPIGAEVYEIFEEEAKRRIEKRDIRD